MDIRVRGVDKESTATIRCCIWRLVSAKPRVVGNISRLFPLAASVCAGRGNGAKRFDPVSSAAPLGVPEEFRQHRGTGQKFGQVNRGAWDSAFAGSGKDWPRAFPEARRKV